MAGVHRLSDLASYRRWVPPTGDDLTPEELAEAQAGPNSPITEDVVDEPPEWAGDALSSGLVTEAPDGDA